MICNNIIGEGEGKGEGALLELRVICFQGPYWCIDVKKEGRLSIVYYLLSVATLVDKMQLMPCYTLMC